MLKQQLRKKFTAHDTFEKRKRLKTPYFHIPQMLTLKSNLTFLFSKTKLNVYNSFSHSLHLTLTCSEKMYILSRTFIKSITAILKPTKHPDIFNACWLHHHKIKAKTIVWFLSLVFIKLENICLSLHIKKICLFVLAFFTQKDNRKAAREMVNHID